MTGRRPLKRLFIRVSKHTGEIQRGLRVIPVRVVTLEMQNTKYDVREVYTSNETPPLPDLDQIEATVYVVVERGWFWKSTFALPESLSKAILGYLRLRPDPDRSAECVVLDCRAFVDLMTRYSLDDCVLMSPAWTLGNLPRRPSLGSVVFLVSPTKESGRAVFHHAAVYLGHGLYLSVWGAGGDLEVMTLENMKTAFEKCEARLALPRSRTTPSP
jgi:hypothetical protein